MWGCGRDPHPHTYPSLFLESGLFVLSCYASDSVSNSFNLG